MRSSAASAALLIVLASCQHAPPDTAARAAPDVAAVVRRVPRAEELRGSWISVEVRGDVEALGHTFLYCFAENGRYTGAVTSEVECVPLEGAYSLRIHDDSAVLTLDDGLEFQVALLDERMELQSPGGYLVLRRLAAPATVAGSLPSSEDLERAR